MIKRLVGAAIRAAVRIAREKAASRQYSPEIILTIWQRRLLAEDWVDRLEGFDAVSLKCVDGSKFYQRNDMLKMLVELEDVDIGIHGWGFHYCRNAQEAEQEAKRAAEACVEFDLCAYHFNAEKQWAASEDPQANAAVFSEIFRANAPGVRLFANCFKSHATTSMLDHFDVFEPMCYGTKISTIAKKIKSRMERPDLSDPKKAIMVGTGRREKSGAGFDGRAWGYLNGDDGHPGLKQLVAAHKPVSVNFFLAGRANDEDMMVEGNSVNPTLSEQALLIREFVAAQDGIVA